VPYGHVVAVADTYDQFIEACDAALAMSAEQKAKMIETMRAIVAGTSWQVTADRMRALIETTPRSLPAVRTPAVAVPNYGYRTA
jgi:UDP-galactopyranose mutase